MNLNSFFASILGLCIAIGATIGLLIVVEMYSAVVHPFPEGGDESVESICKHVEQYPGWVLATVIPMWGAIAYLGTWISIKLGNWVSGYAMGALLIGALMLNMVMLPYPVWFKILQPITVLIAIFIAVGTPKRSVRTLE